MGWGKVAEKLANFLPLSSAEQNPSPLITVFSSVDQVMWLASIFCEEELLLVPKGQGDLAAEKQEPEL